MRKIRCNKKIKRAAERVKHEFREKGLFRRAQLTLIDFALKRLDTFASEEQS